MSDSDLGSDVQVPGSGGTMTRLVGPARARPVGLELLEPLRRAEGAGPWPLDDEWTQWRPPADWEPPPLPDTALVREARRTTLPR